MRSMKFVVAAAVIACAIPAASRAETEPPGSFLCGKIPSSGQAFTFQEVDVLDTPAGGNVIARLPAAHPVTLASGQSGRVAPPGARFCQEKWLHVETEWQGKPVTGFVSGEGPALVNLELPAPEGVARLLVGHDPKLAKADLELVVHRQGKALARQTLKPRLTRWGSYSGYEVGGAVLQDKGLGPGLTVVVLSMRYEACGYDNPDVLAIWTGRELVLGPVADSVSEAGVFNVRSSFVFPSDPEGVQGQVQVVTTTRTEYSEQARDYTKRQSRLRSYTWDGKRFVE